MPRPAATEEDRAEQRRRLRVAAAELHAEAGLHAVTVRAVSKRAGVSTGLLYSYFTDLSDLMRSLWMPRIVELGHALAMAEQAEADPVERIRRLLLTYVDFTVANVETHRGLLLFVRPPNSTPDRNDDPERLMLFASLRRALDEGQAAGAVRSGDTGRLAQLLWSGVHGALALPIHVEPFALTDGPSIATEMVDVLIRSITTKESP